MALTVDWPDPFGTGTIPGAYLRWTGQSVDRPIRTIQAWFLVFRDKAASDAGKAPLDQLHMWADDATDPSYETIRVAQAAQAQSLDQLIYEFAKLWLASVRPDLQNVADAE